MTRADFFVTLIRPPNVLPANSHQAQQGVPPLGLAYLAGSLRSAGFAFCCIDGTGEKLQHYHRIRDNFLGHGLTNAEVIDRIPASTRIIGISCMFASEWFYTRELVSGIRDRFPHSVIVLGGEHATADSDYLLRENPAIDFILHGEGEEALIEFCNTLYENRDPRDLAGISYRSADGKTVRTPARARIRDLEKIPRPDWSALPLEKYLALGYGNNVMGQRSIPMLASRGCPYRCSFCSSPQMWTRRWAARDTDSVLDEIEFYILTYRIEHVEFYDLTTIIDRDWILTFCRKLRARGLGIAWSLPSGTRSEALDREVLSELYRSGCRKLTLAPESGSPETLKKIRKQVQPRKMLRVIADARRENLISKLNIIYGFPEQTWKNVLETMWFLVCAAWKGAHDAACFSFVPYPGSELFDRLVSEGRIRRDENYPLLLADLVNNKAVGMTSWSDRLSDLSLNTAILSSMALFYTVSFICRPHRAGLMAFRVLRGRPVTMLEMLLCGVYRNFFGGLKSQALRRPV